MLMRWAYHRADRILVISAFVKRKIESQGFVMPNPHIVPVGVDTKRFSGGADTPAEMPSPYLISVGPIKHRKGYHLSIPAFMAIAEEFPNLSYLIAGNPSPGPYADALLEEVAHHGLSERVICVGAVDDTRLASLYAHASIFVLTPVSTDSNIEGFGMVYLEAGSSGIPVIGTYDSGAEAAIEDDRSGLLVEPTCDAVAEALRTLLQDPERRTALGEYGKTHAEVYSWESVVDMHIQHFNDLIAPNAS